MVQANVTSSNTFERVLTAYLSATGVGECNG